MANNATDAKPSILINAIEKEVCEISTGKMTGKMTKKAFEPEAEPERPIVVFGGNFPHVITCFLRLWSGVVGVNADSWPVNGPYSDANRFCARG